MKTAIYIEDGALQVVLTPESEFERYGLKLFKDKRITAQIFEGQFYDCRGGWTRQKEYYGNQAESYLMRDTDDSLIVRVKVEKEVE